MVEWVITMSIQTRSTWDKSQDVITYSSLWRKDESVIEVNDFLMSYNATIKCLSI